MIVSGSEKKISNHDFLRLSQFIHQHYGIHLPPAKKFLIESRLGRRIKLCAMPTFGEYCDYLFTEQGMKNELHYMIDAVTTNVTAFFREPHHFEYLTREVLPRLVQSHPAGKKKIRIWSAACATGEEPYTLAMVLNEFARGGSCPDYSILATDISSQALGIAQTAIYNEDKIAPIPYLLRKKYLLKSKDSGKKMVRITPELRNRVTFFRYNLMARQFPVPEMQDVIFCRNVLIYFDGPTQKRLISHLSERLAPGGYLFLGHAESINTLNGPVGYVAPTIYRKEMSSMNQRIAS
jgi:chemotaxis protein methyltransferase CheR